MKRLILAAATLLLSGCAHQTLPVWAVTAPEATAGTVIASGVAIVNQYEQDQKDCAATPKLTKCPGVANATIKQSVTAIQKSLVIALPAYKTWSAALKANPSAVESDDLAGAITAIQGALNQIPNYTK